MEEFADLYHGFDVLFIFNDLVQLLMINLRVDGVISIKKCTNFTNDVVFSLHSVDLIHEHLCLARFFVMS